MTFTVLKGNFLPYNNSQFEYQGFDREVFLHDLQRVPWHVPHVFDDINDVYLAHDSLFREVINEHVPLKLKKRRKNSAPFMNSELRRAINFKKALRRKYLKNKTDKNRTNFTKQRFFFPCLSFIQISFTNYKILHIIETCEKIQVSLCKTAYLFSPSLRSSENKYYLFYTVSILEHAWQTRITIQIKNKHYVLKCRCCFRFRHCLYFL